MSHDEQPGKASGMKDKVVGKIKETAGKVTKNEELTEKGLVQEQHGEAVIQAANAEKAHKDNKDKAHKDKSHKTDKTHKDKSHKTDKDHKDTKVVIGAVPTTHPVVATTHSDTTHHTDKDKKHKDKDSKHKDKHAKIVVGAGHHDTTTTGHHDTTTGHHDTSTTVHTEKHKDKKHKDKDSKHHKDVDSKHVVVGATPGMAPTHTIAPGGTLPAAQAIHNADAPHLTGGTLGTTHATTAAGAHGATGHGDGFKEISHSESHGVTPHGAAVHEEHTKIVEKTVEEHHSETKKKEKKHH